MFVPFSAVGDRLHARLTERRRRFARAEIEAILVPGLGRVEPRCPYYGKCGSCCYQHLTPQEQMRAKVEQLCALLTRAGGLRQLPPVEDAPPAPEVYGYRNKITLKPVRRSGRTVGWGYTALDNVSVLPIEACSIARPELNEKLSSLRASILSAQTAARLMHYEKPPKGRQFLTSGAAERLPAGAPKDELVLRRSATGEVLAFRRAPDKLLTETVLGRALKAPAAGFFQVNPPVLDHFAAWLREAAEEISPETLVDGYCGSGVVAGCLADLVLGEVSGLESDRAAVRCAQENFQAAGLARCRFVAGKSEEHLDGALASLPRADRAAVLLDPPRAGCSPRVLEILLRRAPRTVLMLSCNPSTLARDLARLRVGQAYTLRRLALFDMFPQTAHFETAAVLEKEHA